MLDYNELQQIVTYYRVATYWLNINKASLQTSSQLKASIYYNNIQLN